MMVDILRGVGLVVHQEATVSEANVLNENRIDGPGSLTDIRHFQAPNPSGLSRMQRERYAVSESARLAFPNKTVASSAEPALGALPGGRDGDGRRAAHAQIQPGDASVDRRSEQLIDHRRPVFASVFDREDAAVWKNANRQACAVLDPIEAEIVVARRRPIALARRRHSASLLAASSAGSLPLPGSMRQIELRCAGQAQNEVLAEECRRRPATGGTNIGHHV